jgi:hypothetical protein
VTVSDGAGYQSGQVKFRVTCTFVIENLSYLPTVIKKARFTNSKRLAEIAILFALDVS